MEEKCKMFEFWTNMDSGTMCENSPEQVQRLLASNNTEMMGTFETLSSIARKQGFKQLFSGLSINYLKVRNQFLYLISFHI